jgi:hypothetical protein
MLISTALAHGNLHTGSTGGGDAVLIILAVAMFMAFGYRQHKKRQRLSRTTMATTVDADS